MSIIYVLFDWISSNTILDVEIGFVQSLPSSLPLPLPLPGHSIRNPLKLIQICHLISLNSFPAEGVEKSNFIGIDSIAHHAVAVTDRHMDRRIRGIRS